MIVNVIKRYTDGDLILSGDLIVSAFFFNFK